MDDDESALTEYGDGRVARMEKCLSASVDQLLIKTDELIREGKWDEATELMRDMERKTRLAADARSNARVQVAIVEAYFKANRLNELKTIIASLCKKRTVIKRSICEMVRACYNLLLNVADGVEKLNLVDVLIDVTSGKTFVEVERVRLVVLMATMKENSGDINAAKDILCNVQVESCGSMEERERIEILIHQLRLCILVGNFGHARETSKRISINVFTDSDEQIQKLHVQYRYLIIKVDERDEDYLTVSLHYQKLSCIPLVINDQKQHADVLKKAVIYALLAPYKKTQIRVLKRMCSESVYDAVPEYRNFAKLFIQRELLQWATDVEPPATLLLGDLQNSSNTGMFDASTKQDEKYWEILKTRTAQHNVKMISKYYSRISLDRMCGLLNWDQATTEKLLRTMMADGVISNTKVNRAEGFVSFKPKQTYYDVVDAWKGAQNDLMDSIMYMEQQIRAETLLHNAFPFDKQN